MLQCQGGKDKKEKKCLKDKYNQLYSKVYSTANAYLTQELNSQVSYSHYSYNALPFLSFSLMEESLVSL